MPLRLVFFQHFFYIIIKQLSISRSRLVTSICTVDLLIPKTAAARLTVAPVSRMYSPISTHLLSTLPIKVFTFLGNIYLDSVLFIHLFSTAQADQQIYSNSKIKISKGIYILVFIMV